ncbi:MULTISPECIES: hypothetical protein [unclassified Streptomyces]|uniref:hypothetical protein n=1 Tax=unclassified Streptomyces TaxID=2593676 RepID=UPI0016601CC3|nr:MULTISPECIES: hypothetical protein [unclassified Streptomyces]MBD0707089.1 hypothetical protein [Streptomyces sp. CBMA291]MBD0714274.1 hypothetical protein [Streptomyces sp. CBMA370]
MRAARTLAVTATAIAAVGLASPLAAANNGPSDVTVNPFDVHAGSTITITAKGCGHGGTVRSNAFPESNLSVNSNGLSSAIARVHDHATPGSYNLAVRCSDNSSVVTHSFRVLPGRGTQGGLGGSLAPSSAEMAVGGSLVAAAALGGSLFVARRRRVVGAGV